MARRRLGSHGGKSLGIRNEEYWSKCYICGEEYPNLTAANKKPFAEHKRNCFNKYSLEELKHKIRSKSPDERNLMKISFEKNAVYLTNRRENINVELYGARRIQSALQEVMKESDDDDTDDEDTDTEETDLLCTDTSPKNAQPTTDNKESQQNLHVPDKHVKRVHKVQEANAVEKQSKKCLFTVQV